MNIIATIQYMYPDARFLDNWQVGMDDQGNQYITFWDYGDVPQPTDAELAANESKALALIALNNAKMQAQAALDASDITVLRLIELNSTFVPQEWKTYRTALRAVINATDPAVPQTIPIRPSSPAPGQ